MNFRPQRKDDLTVDITPLIDVVFLLLIFFMVTTTFERESQIEIVLPKASVEAPPADQFVMNITIDKQGTFFINGQRVLNSQLETLKKAMQEVAGERKDPPIILSADAQTPHQYVVTVMDASRQLGFVHLNFATTRSSEAQ